MTIQETSQHRVTVADGRELDVAVYGSPEGPAVVLQHGTPGSAIVLPALDEAAAPRGLRVVAPTRAGYGSSTRDEGRDVAAVADDIARTLDALGIVRFTTVGWSGGGPHALACAALLPERCAAAISLAGVAPYRPDEFDWTAGMAEENVHEFTLSLKGGPEYDESLASSREAMLSLTFGDPPSMRDLFGGLASDVDNALGPDAVVAIHEVLCRGLAEGYGGWLDDDQAMLAPWGFDVEAIEVPVGIWDAAHDNMVPTTHGAWLAANVRGAVARHFPDDGHLTIGLAHSDELLDGIVELAGGSW
jgi:pimeloyl-ACP methyl ester carboxylesterase